MIPTMPILGVLLIGCGIRLFFIKASRFTKTRDIATGITVVTDKKTGKEYIQLLGSNLTEI